MNCMYCHTELIYRGDSDIEIVGHETIESNLHCLNCDAEVLVYKIGEKEKNETK